MNSYFMNPANRYVEKATGPLTWLWALLFGPAYFLYKGAWQWALVYVLIPIYLGSASRRHIVDESGAIIVLMIWIVLAPFAYPAIKKAYRRSGWVETSIDHEASLRSAEVEAARRDPRF